MDGAVEVTVDTVGWKLEEEDSAVLEDVSASPPRRRCKCPAAVVDGVPMLVGPLDC